MDKHKTLKEFFEHCYWIYPFDSFSMLRGNSSFPTFYLFYQDKNCDVLLPEGSENIRIMEVGFHCTHFIVFGECISDLCEEFNLAFTNSTKQDLILWAMPELMPEPRRYMYFDFAKGNVFQHYRTIQRWVEIKKLTASAVTKP